MRLGDLPVGTKFWTRLTHRAGEVRSQEEFGAVEVVWLSTPNEVPVKVHAGCQVDREDKE